MSNAVTEIAAAASELALAHFRRKLELETDCSDVRAALAANGADPGFVLVDVRGRASYAQAHAAGAINIPHRDLTARRLADYPATTLFVVYCAGPHCNGADRAAVRLAELGRPVKVMIGGMTGWADEGYELESGQPVIAKAG